MSKQQLEYRRKVGAEAVTRMSDDKCAARIASDEACACDRYPYCSCGRNPDADELAGDVLDEAIYEQTGRHPADG